MIPQYPGHKTDERGSRRTRRRRSGGPGLPAPCCRQLCRGLCLRRRRSRLALRRRLLTTRPPRAPAECAAGASSPHLGRRRALAPDRWWRGRERPRVCAVQGVRKRVSNLRSLIIFKQFNPGQYSLWSLSSQRGDATVVHAWREDDHAGGKVRRGRPSLAAGSSSSHCDFHCSQS